MLNGINGVLNDSGCVIHTDTMSMLCTDNAGQIVVCGLHGKMEEKIDILIGEVQDLKIMLAEKKGEENAEEKQKAEQKECKANKRGRRERITDGFLGALLVFTFYVAVETVKYFLPFIPK
jgi:hypothetical protein